MDENNNIIFVGGIHGVGKTTLCNYLSNKLNIKNYSSSELISRLNSEKVAIDKKVDDIGGNQNILLESIDLFLDRNHEYILDGHFCLIDKNDRIEPVPLGVFNSLGIKKIIVVIDDSQEIAKRIKNRDNRTYSIDFIEEFQKNEIEQVKYISSKLGIEHKIIRLNEKEKLLEFLQE